MIYLVGSTVSLHGLWIYRVALGWFAWKLTGSEFWVGIVAFTQFAPAVVFGPLFGVLAIAFNISRLVGPAIAGIDIAMSCVGAAFAISGIS